MLRSPDRKFARRLLAPYTRLRFGTPAGPLTPTAQPRGAFSRRGSRGWVGCSSRRSRAGGITAGGSVVPMIQWRWQRGSSRLPGQGRIHGTLSRRRRRWSRSDGSNRLASRFAILRRTTAGRGVAGAVCLFQRTFGGGRVGLGAGIATCPFAMLDADRRRIDRRLGAAVWMSRWVAAVLIGKGRGTSHVRGPTVMGG